VYERVWRGSAAWRERERCLLPRRPRPRPPAESRRCALSLDLAQLQLAQHSLAAHCVLVPRVLRQQVIQSSGRRTGLSSSCRSSSSPAHADAKSLSAGCKVYGISTPTRTSAGRCPSPAGADEAGPERSPRGEEDPRLLERGRGEERERRRTELPPDEHPADLLRAGAHLVQEGVAQEAVDLVVVRVAVAAVRRRLVSPDLKTRSSEAEEERRTHPSIWSASRQTSVARSDE